MQSWTGRMSDVIWVNCEVTVEAAQMQKQKKSIDNYAGITQARQLTQQKV